MGYFQGKRYSPVLKLLVKYFMKVIFYLIYFSDYSFQNLERKKESWFSIISLKFFFYSVVHKNKILCNCLNIEKV